MASVSTDRLGLKVFNVLVFLFFFSSSLYSVIAPGSEAGQKLTYLTPAPWGFYVWSLIDLLLLGTVIIQFFDVGHEAVVEGLGFNFAIIGLLNSAWVWFFHHNHHIIGFIVVILLTLAVSATYWKLKTQNPPKNGVSAVFVHLPFSLWHAYSIVLLLITGATVFGRDKAHQHAGLGSKIAACVAIVFLASTSVGYAFHSNQGDIAGAAVIAFELIAIFVAQQHPRVIHWFALGGFIVSLLAIVKAVFYTARNPSLTGDDGERAPLIAGSS